VKDVRKLISDISRRVDGAASVAPFAFWGAQGWEKPMRPIWRSAFPGAVPVAAYILRKGFVRLLARRVYWDEMPISGTAGGERMGG
jgi:hypothetical protein